MFMKTITHVILIAALALPTAVTAQQPSTRYAFHTVAQPGTIIGGRTFTRETVIGSAAINDAAEVAFVAKAPSPQPVAVFTSRRIVAREGDVIGGKYIVLIPADGILAINNAGQVAYEAWYADTWERASAMDYSGRGIFVDDHLASNEVFDARGNPSPFIFTDDGRIVVQNPGHAPASPKNAPARIGLKLPRESVSVSAGAGRAAPHKPSAAVHPSLMPFPMNHHGQILIPVNFGAEGFLLLLGTPGAR
jgi:hypothetical protein